MLQVHSFSAWKIPVFEKSTLQDTLFEMGNGAVEAVNQIELKKEGKKAGKTELGLEAVMHLTCVYPREMKIGSKATLNMLFS